jgi:hypothetical protein
VADRVELARSGCPGGGVDTALDGAPPASELQLVAAFAAGIGVQEVGV